MRDSSRERAASHSTERGLARLHVEGGRDDQAPGMGARTPAPLLELLYGEHGVTLRTGDRAFRETNPRKRMSQAERDEHEAARLIMDTIAELEDGGKIVVFDRHGVPAAVVLPAKGWAALTGWHG